MEGLTIVWADWMAGIMSGIVKSLFYFLNFSMLRLHNSLHNPAAYDRFVHFKSQLYDTA